MLDPCGSPGPLFIPTQWDSIHRILILVAVIEILRFSVSHVLLISLLEAYPFFSLPHSTLSINFVYKMSGDIFTITVKYLG